MLYNIEQIKTSNFGSRGKYIPIMIVNHITDGEEAVRTSDEHEESAVENTFISPNSNASAHFDILRDGRIKQYVKISDKAWTQGISVDDVKYALSPIVRQMGINPNAYCVSKEYEAYSGHGGSGDITEEQFLSGCWLDKFIQAEVKKLYGTTLQLNSTFMLGHKDIDPHRRKFDPGVKFPWARIFSELAMAETMTLEQYEEHIAYMKSVPYSQATIYALMLRLTDLSTKLTGIYATEAARKLLLLTPCLEQLGYAGDITAKGIYDWFKSLYEQAIAQKWDADTVRLLMFGAKLAKEVGLVA